MGNNTKIKKRIYGLFELIYDNKKDNFDVTVEIVDAIMGSGKSTEIFKFSRFFVSKTCTQWF